MSNDTKHVGFMISVEVNRKLNRQIDKEKQKPRFERLNKSEYAEKAIIEKLNREDDEESNT